MTFLANDYGLRFGNFIWQLRVMAGEKYYCFAISVIITPEKWDNLLMRRY
jgi:hypothetical protein